MEFELLQQVFKGLKNKDILSLREGAVLLTINTYVVTNNIGTLMLLEHQLQEQLNSPLRTTLRVIPEGTPLTAPNLSFDSVFQEWYVRIKEMAGAVQVLPIQWFVDLFKQDKRFASQLGWFSDNTDTSKKNKPVLRVADIKQALPSIAEICIKSALENTEPDYTPLKEHSEVLYKALNGEVKVDGTLRPWLELIPEWNVWLKSQALHCKYKSGKYDLSFKSMCLATSGFDINKPDGNYEKTFLAATRQAFIKYF